MSINWRAIKTARDWTNLAEEQIIEARDGIRSGDIESMKRTSDRLLRFLERRTTACPREVAEAVFQVQTELSQAVAAGATGSIAGRTAQVNAYLQDVQRISRRLKEAAAMISLEKVRKTVGEVTGAVKELKRIQAKLQSYGAGAAADGIAGVISRLQESVDSLE